MNTWLAARTGRAPEVLRARLEDRAPPDSDASRAEQLAEAAEELLARVEAHPGDRSIALDLLAADALITLALLAIAETHPERLAEFAAGRLTRVAPRT